MDLAFTEEQELLRQTVREMCAKHSAPDQVRALEEDPRGYDEALWSQLAQIGILGLTIDESYGGAGTGALENVIVFSELGRALASSPAFVSGVVAAGVLARGGNDAVAKEWLPKIASGEAVVSVAWLEPNTSCDAFAMTDLTGTKTMVPFASAADRLVVVAADGLFLVDPSQASLEQIPTLARDASYTVTLDGASGEQVGDRSTWDEVMTDALIAAAAQAIGGAERALEMTIEYAKERVQFDRPIGSFQGIAHPIADMATEIEGSRVVTYEAAWARDAGKAAAPTLAAMAKYQAADTFKRTTKVGQQVYGGIGFTLEIDMQLYFRRAKQLELTWWDPPFLEERIARAELDAPTPFVGVDARYDD